MITHKINTACKPHLNQLELKVVKWERILNMARSMSWLSSSASLLKSWFLNVVRTLVMSLRGNKVDTLSDSVTAHTVPCSDLLYLMIFSSIARNVGTAKNMIDFRWSTSRPADLNREVLKGFSTVLIALCALMRAWSPLLRLACRPAVLTYVLLLRILIYLTDLYYLHWLQTSPIQPYLAEPFQRGHTGA